MAIEDAVSKASDLYWSGATAKMLSDIAAPVAKKIAARALPAAAKGALVRASGSALAKGASRVVGGAFGLPGMAAAIVAPWLVSGGRALYERSKQKKWERELRERHGDEAVDAALREVSK